MKWVNVNKRKPETDCAIVYVMNLRRGRDIFPTIYYKSDDIFLLYEPDKRTIPVPVDATHWIVLPFPRLDPNNSGFQLMVEEEE